MHSVQNAEADDDGTINHLPAGLLNHVFAFLGPVDLCRVTATCQLWRRLNRDRAANTTWRRFYCSRWHSALEAVNDVNDVCWQSMYGSKMLQGKAWSGKYHSDCLYGHKAAVRCLQLLPSHNLLVTGSVDKTVRLWDLQLGMPVSISKLHGGTVRSVALDPRALISGCSDNLIRLWTPTTPAAATTSSATGVPTAAAAGSSSGGIDIHGDQLPRRASSSRLALELEAAAAAAAAGSVRSATDAASVASSTASQWLFDLTRTERQLKGHIGPVSTLCLTSDHLVSGSWDYTARVWRRGSWECVRVHKYSDWLAAVVVRGPHLLVAAGPEVHVHDMGTGQLVRKFESLHEGCVSCLEGTRNGKLLFSGGADGLVLAHDLRMRDPSAIVWHHNSAVQGLGYEDPWLVTAAADGSVIMLNTEELHISTSSRNNNSSSSSSPAATAVAGSGSGSSAAANGRYTSQLHNSKRSLASGGSGVYCVDIADQWVAAGGASEVVKTWDFTRAAEAAARAAAAKAARGSRRNRRRGGSNSSGSAGCGGGGVGEDSSGVAGVKGGSGRRKGGEGRVNGQQGMGGPDQGVYGSSPRGGLMVAGSPPCPQPVRPCRHHHSSSDQTSAGPPHHHHHPRGHGSSSLYGSSPGSSYSSSPVPSQWRPGCYPLPHPPHPSYGSPLGAAWSHQQQHQHQQQQVCYSAPSGPWSGSWPLHTGFCAPPWHTNNNNSGGGGGAGAGSSRRGPKQGAGARVPPSLSSGSSSGAEGRGPAAAGAAAGDAAGGGGPGGVLRGSSPHAEAAAAAAADGSSSGGTSGGGNGTGTAGGKAASKAAAAPAAAGGVGTAAGAAAGGPRAAATGAAAAAAAAGSGSSVASIEGRMATWQLPQRTRSFGADVGTAALVGSPGQD